MTETARKSGREKEEPGKTNEKKAKGDRIDRQARRKIDRKGGANDKGKTSGKDRGRMENEKKTGYQASFAHTIRHHTSRPLFPRPCHLLFFLPSLPLLKNTATHFHMQTSLGSTAEFLLQQYV